MALDTLILETGSAGADFVFKSTTEAYYYSNPTFTKITSANFPSITVRGVVYLDGTYYVMDPKGNIFGSAINNPASWSALNVIASQSEPDSGVCLSRQLNLIVSFGKYSTEFFYDAANPIGSPLLPYTSAFLEIGCATADSVAQGENNIVFMSTARHKGRSIQVLEGTVPKVISTPFVDRILDRDTLVNVNAVYFKSQGHAYYVLALPSSNITLVYDFSSGLWSSWTSLKSEIKNELCNVFSLLDGELTLTTLSGITKSVGDIIEIINTPELNGLYVITKTSGYSYTINVGLPTLITKKIILSSYKETPYNISGKSKTGNLDLVQDSTTGAVMAINGNSFKDNGAPIKFKIRTAEFNGGNNHLKFFSRLDILGDKIVGNGYIRYTNDDYNTWSIYRPINLNLPRSKIDRLGRARRRAFEFVCVEPRFIRVSSFDLDITTGFN
jgi:Phage stabilisation protein